jgi:hypothetical protein
MNIKINICVREETAHLATLKSKKYIKTLQRLKQEWQKSPALGPGKQTAKLGLVWRNRKNISQTADIEGSKSHVAMINAYLYLLFFLLIIL